MRDLAIAALFALSCATTVEVPSDPIALEWMERWSAEEQGYDNMAAYEMVAPGDRRTAFAVVRRWEGDSVRTLSYTVGTRSRSQVLAGTTSFSPGWRTDTWISRESNDQVFVEQFPTAFSGPLSLDGVSVPVMIGRPWLIRDFAHQLVREESIGTEPCVVIDSVPSRRVPGTTRIRSWVSKEKRVTLRRVYFKGDTERGRYEVDPEDVEKSGERFRVRTRTIRTADGQTGKVHLRNELSEIPVPASLFTRRTLQARRFPSF